MARSNQKAAQNSGNKENLPDSTSNPGTQTTTSQATEGSVPTKKRALWTAADDVVLISYLETAVANGLSSDNGFKKAVWQGAAAEVNKILGKGNTGGPKTPKSCQDHFTALKAVLKDVDRVIGKSGGGWDDEKHMVTGTDDWWNQWIAEDAKVAKWHTETFPLYTRMKALTQGHHATGDESISITAFPQAQKSKEVPNYRKVLDEMDDSRDSSPTPDPVSSDSQTSFVAPAHTPRTSLKHQRSSSSDMLEERVFKRKGRISGAAAVADVAEALKDIASSVSLSSGAKSSPERRVTAIRAAEKDTDMNDEQKVALIHLFQDKISYVDTYLAFENPKLRTAYFNSVLTQAK